MNKSPLWFKIVAVVALIWNLLGAIAVIMNFTITPEAIADAVAIMGISVLIMQGSVFVIAIGLLLLAKMAIKRGWVASARTSKTF